MARSGACCARDSANFARRSATDARPKLPDVHRVGGTADARGWYMRAAALGQGTYYVVTGLAPLISMDAFEAVTGDKTDEWLVVMVALLTVVIGATPWRTPAADAPPTSSSWVW